MTITPLSPNSSIPLIPAVYAPERHPLSNAIRASVYPVVPDRLLALVKAEDRLIKAQELIDADTSEDFASWSTRTASALAAGDNLPDDFVAEAQSCIEAADRYRVSTAAVNGLRASIQSRWTVALRDDADEMLVGLRSHLDALLPKVHAAAVVVDNIDIEDAESISGATAKELRAIQDLKGLRAEYRGIRRAQRALTPHAHHGEYPPSAWGHSSWRSFFQSRHHEFSDITRLGVPDETSELLWFRPLVDRRDVWLPTYTDLTDALN